MKRKQFFRAAIAVFAVLFFSSSGLQAQSMAQVVYGNPQANKGQADNSKNALTTTFTEQQNNNQSRPQNILYSQIDVGDDAKLVQFLNVLLHMSFHTYVDDVYDSQHPNQAEFNNFANTLTSTDNLHKDPDLAAIQAAGWRPDWNEDFLERKNLTICQKYQCFPELWKNDNLPGLAILVFRGTHPSARDPLGDIGSDIALGVGETIPRNLVVAQVVAEHAVRKYPGLILTGHSKGAAEAAYSAARINRKAIVFCSPGIPIPQNQPKQFLSGFQDMTDLVGNISYDEYIKCYFVFPAWLPDSLANDACNLYRRSDPVVGLGKSVSLLQLKYSIVLPALAYEDEDNIGEIHANQGRLAAAMARMPQVDPINFKKIRAFLTGVADPGSGNGPSSDLDGTWVLTRTQTSGEEFAVEILQISGNSIVKHSSVLNGNTSDKNWRVNWQKDVANGVFESDGRTHLKIHWKEEPFDNMEVANATASLDKQTLRWSVLYSYIYNPQIFATLKADYTDSPDNCLIFRKTTASIDTLMNSSGKENLFPHSSNAN
jgi:hypothetical protein